MTPYHAKYYAHELSRVGGEGVDRLGRAIFDASVELNPHQIEAALFALRSPLSKGVLLADEVGLGKNHRGRPGPLPILGRAPPAALGDLPRISSQAVGSGAVGKIQPPLRHPRCQVLPRGAKGRHPQSRPAGGRLVSIHFAGRNADLVQAVPWDLVVIDEAHKLRNAYRESSRLGQAIRRATADRRKILLTATPLQNSLVELYGLSTLIDDNLFGELLSFYTQYMSAAGDLEGLRERFRAFCWRTLRRDVLEYVKYTERRLITRPFTPSDAEQKLYEAVSAFLPREEEYALPSGQRHLLILLVRKVLASSPRAVAGTLEIILDRLRRLREDARQNATAVQQLTRLPPNATHSWPWSGACSRKPKPPRCLPSGGPWIETTPAFILIFPKKSE